MTTAELFAELANAPDLHGAVCADPAARALFDAAPGDVEAEESALWACSCCPALQACQAWLGLPQYRRPLGVVGGLVIGRGGRTRRRRSTGV